MVTLFQAHIGFAIHRHFSEKLQTDLIRRI